MSGKERGVFQVIYKHLMIAIKRKSKKHELIGEDYYGTKYYEIRDDPPTRKNLSRYFVPVNEDEHEQEIPAEWEAWLRHRRKDAPTVEEVERNYQIQIMKKENAAKLAAEFSGKKSDKANLPSEGEYRAFPTYEEYKNDGRDYQVKYLGGTKRNK